MKGHPRCPDCRGLGYTLTRDDEGLPERERCACTRGPRRRVAVFSGADDQRPPRIRAWPALEAEDVRRVTLALFPWAFSPELVDAFTEGRTEDARAMVAACGADHLADLRAKRAQAALLLERQGDIAPPTVLRQLQRRVEGLDEAIARVVRRAA